MTAAALAVVRPFDPLEPESAAKLTAAFLAGRNARTLRGYASDLEDFARFLGVVGADAAIEVLLSRGNGAANALVLDYRAHMLERGLAPATVNRRLSAVRAMVRFARLRGAITWGVDVPGVRAEKYRDTRGPGAEACRAMAASAGRRDDAKGRRDLAILRLLFDLGLRRFEVAGLELEHLDVAGGRVNVLRKGKRQRTWLDLPPETLAALRGWVDARGAAPGPLFLVLDHAHRGRGLSDAGVWYAVRALGATVGLKVRPHAIRHTAVTEISRLAQAAGMRLEEVLDFSGHADVRTLQIYLDRQDSKQGKLARMLAATL